MVQFRVNAPTLSAAAASIGGVIGVFDGNLSAVASRVASVAGNTWQGKDADAFVESWKAFETNAAAIRLVLTSLQARLIAADGTYTQTELGTQRSFTGNRPSIVAIRKGAQAYAKVIAVGEERAEDMAEFFGRDYAGDKQKEQFGGGAVGRRGGGRSGVAGDSDGDGDSDVKGNGVFLSNESAQVLYGDDSGKEAGFVTTEAGVEQQSELTLGEAQPAEAVAAESTDAKAEAGEARIEPAGADGGAQVEAQPAFMQADAAQAKGDR